MPGTIGRGSAGIAPRLAAAAVALALAACGPDARSEGTRAMAARLAEIAERTDPAGQPYENDARAEWLASLPEEADPAARLERSYRVAVELLQAGRSRDALRRLGELEREVGRDALREVLALAYLRLAEQTNCIEHHGADSCLVPIRAGGVHARPEYSREAMRELEHVLAASPDDLAARWLYNLAAMTVGEWPEGVEERWRIPAEAFASEHEVPRFVDVASECGVAAGGLAGGVATDDFTGDGLLDVLVSSWGIDDPLRLFVSRGDGTFEDRSDAMGLEGVGGGLNLVHADCDGDGDNDAFVLRGAWLGFPPATDGGEHPNSLLQNRGDGRFDDATEEAGLLSFHPTQTAAFADLDNDGDLDLFVGNESFGEAVHPCELFWNRGDGTFRDGAGAAGVALVSMVKGVTAGDYDGDGWTDLYASCLSSANRLYRNRGAEGTFEEVAARAGVEEPAKSFPTWFFDFDADGALDLFASGYRATLEGGIHDVAADFLGEPTRAELPRLYRNRGDGTFEDVTAAAGLDRVLFTMGCNFGDLDGDGWLDFYLGTGDPDLRSLMPNRMFRNDRGRRFQDVTASGGFGHVQKGHGIAFADLDDDGDQDVYAVMGGAFSGDAYPNALFENPGTGARWITLRLVGATSNRSAIGARVRVRVETEEGGERDVHAVVGTGGSFGSSSLQQELGLGRARRIVSVRIEWPASGTVQELGALELDAFYEVREDASRARRLTVAAFSLGD